MKNKTSNELLTEILSVLNEINAKLEMTKEEKAGIIDEKIRDEVKEEKVDLDFNF